MMLLSMIHPVQDVDIDLALASMEACTTECWVSAV